MSLELIAKHRENAEVYHGPDMCRKKFWELMESLNLPKGLLPFDDEVTELGHNKKTGFLWLIRKNKKEHVYKNISGKAYFDTIVTAFGEDGKLKQMTGVKGKELFVTITIREMYLSGPASEKVTFRTPAGITKSHQCSLFEIEN